MVENRVAITGIGVVSPTGIGNKQFIENLMKGVSGSSPVSSFDASKNKCKIYCRVNNLNLVNYLDAKLIKRTSRFIQLALVASELAISESKIEIDKNNEIGVFIGTGAGGYDSLDDSYVKFINRGPSATSPFGITNLISNMAASNVAIKWGFHGPCSAPVAACASGSYAINDAYNAIRFGLIDTALAGGTESTLTSYVFGGYEALRVLSVNNENPEKASRPFDASRSGFVMGEGASILILENYANAKNRGAKILAEIVASKTSCDAAHLTSPDTTGKIIVKTMEQALKEAKISTSDISFINAHGTSTITNDLVEAKAINHVFGTGTPVTSIKSMIGHTLGASGAIACAASVLSLNSSIIPPTTNYRDRDPKMEPIDVVSTVREEDRKLYSLINAFGFGGHNSCIIVKSNKE